LSAREKCHLNIIAKKIDISRLFIPVVPPPYDTRCGVELHFFVKNIGSTPLRQAASEKQKLASLAATQRLGAQMARSIFDTSSEAGFAHPAGRALHNLCDENVVDCCLLSTH
jgi:hypothetical protein